MTQKTYPFYNNFTSGKLSSLVQSRVDLRQYQKGLRVCENFIVLPHGGVTLRGAFKVIARVKDDAECRIAPFVFSDTPSNSYILEFTNTALRFYKNRSQIMDGGSPYEITTVYETSDLFNIRHAQSADFLYLVDGNHQPQTLKRSGDTSWEITGHDVAGLPFEPSRAVRWRAFTVNDNDIDIVQNESSFDASFESGRTVQELLGSPGNFPLNSAEGIQFGVDGSNVDQPQFLQDYRDGSDLLFENMSLQIDGQILIPVQGKYDFGFNCEPAGKFHFGNNLDTVIYQIRPDHEDVFTQNSYTTNEFAKYWINLSPDTFTTQPYSKSVRAVDENGDDRTLTTGKQAFKIQLAESNTDLERLMKFTLGWRVNADVSFTGSGSDIVQKIWDNNSAHTWNGNRLFEIRVWIDPGNSAQFGWAWREYTDIDETPTAWTAIVGAIATDGTPQSTGDNISSSVETAYFNSVDNTGETFTDTYSFSAAGAASPMARIRFTATTGNPGDYWDFKVGYVPIGSEHFERKDETSQTSYPKLVTIHENRLIYAASSEEPSTFWGSRSGNYDDFQIELIPTAAGAYKYTVGSQQVDPLNWIESSRQLILGGLNSEYVVKGADGYITPVDPPSIKSDTSYGGGFVDSVKIDHTIVFVESNDLRIRELSFDFGVDSYRGIDNSILSYELLQNGIKQMAYQKAGLVGLKYSVDLTGNLNVYVPPVNLLWIVTDTGALKCVTYEKQHNVLAWHEHEVDEGTALIESVAAIPGPDGGDDIYFVIKDVSDGNKRYICYLDDEAVPPKDLSGGDTTYPYQGQLEILPVEIPLGEGQTTRGMVKNWGQIYVTLFGSESVRIARGSADYASTRQILADYRSQQPQDQQVYIFGYDTESTLQLRSGLTDGDQEAQPSTILGIHGKVLVNAP